MMEEDNVPLFSLASREITACAAPEAVLSADVAASEHDAEVCQLRSQRRLLCPIARLPGDAGV